MSGVCYPDSLIGSIPNIYYYAANNPSEVSQRDDLLHICSDSPTLLGLLALELHQTLDIPTLILISPTGYHCQAPLLRQHHLVPDPSR